MALMNPGKDADIVLDGVSRNFGPVPAVDDISIRIDRGELCCLVGPSGCGKSTTLRMIAGLERPDSGSVSINGRDVTASPARSRGVGLVFQNYALFPHMNIYDNVAYGLRCRKVPQAEVPGRVRRALARVRMEKYEKRRPHELSGGEQQRVALARCLVTNPGVLLLDEPFSNLDAGLRADMREELLGLQRDLAITTVFVTHDQEEAMTLADRIVLMDKGRIVQTGPPRDLYEHPESLFAAAFLGKINFLDPGVGNGANAVLGVDLDPAPAPGATVGVRPEHVRISAEPPGEAAIVEEATFTGPLTRYRLRLARTGEELASERPVSEPVFAKGRGVFVSASWNDLHLF